MEITHVNHKKITFGVLSGAPNGERNDGSRIYRHISYANQKKKTLLKMQISNVKNPIENNKITCNSCSTHWMVVMRAVVSGCTNDPLSDQCVRWFQWSLHM